MKGIGRDEMKGRRIWEGGGERGEGKRRVDQCLDLSLKLGFVFESEFGFSVLGLGLSLGLGLGWGGR